MGRDGMGEETDPTAEGRPRRPYTPPRIESSDAFERFAVGCTGMPDGTTLKDPTAPGCNSGGFS